MISNPLRKAMVTCGACFTITCPAWCAGEWSRSSGWGDLPMARCCLLKTLKFSELSPVTSRSRSKTVCFIRSNNNARRNSRLLKEFNESIVESINVGLMAVDLDGRITRLNSALEEIVATDREEVFGTNVEELFAEDFADTLHQVLGESGWHLIQTRQIYKMHTTTRAGRSLVLNIAIAPLWADSQEQTGALVVFEDVTERLRLEEQLQQREKLSSIGLLAAGVAHEVNTPLTGVSSYTQMLLNMLPENDPKHALLEKVRRQADRATDIVNNLLNFSRTGSAAEFTSLDMHRVLDDTLQLLEPQLRRSQIEIVREYDEHLPQVIGNSVKLQQVFTNLILNARDSIANGNGRIVLATRNGEEDSLTVEVADNGVGIDPEDVAKIYDPFFTTKGVGRGTGLGLAVTYGIVQEHSGHISVNSTPGAWDYISHHPSHARSSHTLASRRALTGASFLNWLFIG